MVRKKNIALCIIFWIITCGIYGIYWFVTLTDDTNEIAGEQGGTSGGVAFLLSLVTCGIYGLYWAYKRGELVDKAHQNRGEIASNGGILYLLLYIFAGVIAYALIQNEVNKFAQD